MELHSVECDDEAVLWLRRNAEALASPQHMQVRHEDATQALPDSASEFDVVVCNPPYIPLGSVIRDPEVAQYDPARALWGGSDGLDVVRGISAVAARLLRPGGLVLIEHADVQGESIPAHLASQRHGGEPVWSKIRDHLDLNDRPRCTYAIRTNAGAR
jgi:release factor glutamine methyltransferase